MKISIITISYNSESTIRDTINSVLTQDYPNIEYIIIDGQSKDNTVAIVNEFGNKISHFVSEKDDGIYFAMNKGIDLATGDFIGILNSDDIYADNHVISDVVKLLQQSNSDTLYADLEYVDRNNTSKVLRYWKSGRYSNGLFLKGWMPPHPTFFVKKTVYNQFGKFDTRLKSAADYELMLRFIHKHAIDCVYLERVITKMRVGGKSNRSIKNRIAANKEDRLAWAYNNLEPRLFTLWRKPLSKLSQFIKKKK